MKYICFSFVLFFIIPLHIQAQQWSEYFVVPEMFGCISDSREAAEQNARGLQKVIDYAISKGVTLVSSRNKKYYIDQGLVITGGLDINLGSATIVATDTMKMLTINNGKARQWAGTLRSFRLDMNGKANYGIYCENAIKLRITDGEIVNIKKTVSVCIWAKAMSFLWTTSIFMAHTLSLQAS